ncbi:MAG: NAD(P)-dependent oxidoreductase [Chloroflexota bacterium]
MPGRGPGVAEVLPPYLLPDLLAQSDFIVLALPYTDETNEIIGESALAVVKRGAWLVNIARGGLVDDRALERALRDGRLGGAILDTLREEPLPPTSPLYDVPNLLVTPHTSWSSGRVLDRSIGLFCDNLERYRTGAPLLNRVDVARGY